MDDRDRLRKPQNGLASYRSTVNGTRLRPRASIRVNFNACQSIHPPTPDSIPRMSDCLFCRIVQGQIPAQILLQSDAAVAFADIHPQAPYHALVIPRRHYAHAAEMTERNPSDLVAVFDLARTLAEQSGLSAGGYRMVFNTGTDGGQTVHHAHLHLLGRRKLTWPPG